MIANFKWYSRRFFINLTVDSLNRKLRSTPEVFLLYKSYGNLIRIFFSTRVRKLLKFA